MNRLGLLAAAIVMCGLNDAYADFTSRFDYSTKLNKVSFDNYEIILRSAEAGADGAFQIGSAYYTEVMPDVLKAGDFLVQIYVANGLYRGSDLDSTSDAITFTGYAVQQVKVANELVAFGYLKTTYQAATIDPFGVLSAAELSNNVVAKLFSDPYGTTFTANSNVDEDKGKSLQKDVVNATDGGSPWASFGFGGPVDGTGLVDSPFLESWVSPMGEVAAYGGLNVKSGPAGVQFIGVTNSQIPPAVGHHEKTSMGVESDISLYDQHVSNTGGTSFWRFCSDDPWEFRMTPEPGAVVGLAGLLVTAISLGWWRRRTA